MEKLNAIEGQMNTMQTSMNTQFDMVLQKIEMQSCRDQLGRHQQAISLGSHLLNQYAAAQKRYDPDVDLYKRAFMDSASDGKIIKAVNGILDSIDGAYSNQDFNCDYISLLVNGDTSKFYAGNVAALEEGAAFAITLVALGMSVIAAE